MYYKLEHIAEVSINKSGLQVSLTRLNAREYEYPEEKCANNSNM